MIINNSIRTYAPIAPPYFDGCLFMNATYEMSEELANLFTKGLESLSKHLYEKNIDPTKLFPVSLIFTKDGSFSVTENEATTYGRCMSFLVYSMERIITSNNQHMQLFVFIEELVHYYFQETNETKVKLTTFSVVQKIFPEITFEEVTSWGVNWS